MVLLFPCLCKQAGRGIPKYRLLTGRLLPRHAAVEVAGWPSTVDHKAIRPLAAVVQRLVCVRVSQPGRQRWRERARFGLRRQDRRRCLCDRHTGLSAGGVSVDAAEHGQDNVGEEMRHTRRVIGIMRDLRFQGGVGGAADGGGLVAGGNQRAHSVEVIRFPGINQGVQPLALPKRSRDDLGGPGGKSACGQNGVNPLPFRRVHRAENGDAKARFAGHRVPQREMGLLGPNGILDRPGDSSVWPGLGQNALHPGQRNRFAGIAD